MIGRRRAVAEEQPPVDDESGSGPAYTPGKGHATPKRREAQGRKRRPANPKEATAARRQNARDTRAAQRNALLTGDERNLPPRDAGPARRLARDVVDSRFTVGQVLFGVIIVVFLLSLLNVPVVRLVANVVALLLVVLIIADGYRVARQARMLVAVRHGVVESRGIAQYALLRALMPRRMRRPPPAISRGDQPR